MNRKNKRAMVCKRGEEINKHKEELVDASEKIEEILKSIFPVQLPKNVLRDLILSMDRGERRFFALKLRRYNKKDKDASSIVKLYEILSRHATPNRDEIEILRKHAGDMPHLEQVRQRLIKLILFALVEYRYMKQQKNIYVAIAEIMELLEKKQMGAAKALFRRVTADYDNATKPFHKILIVDALIKILSEVGPTIGKDDNFEKLYFMFSYDFLEKALDGVYRYRKVVHAINDLARAVVIDSFPVTKSTVGNLDQCVEDVTKEFLDGSFSVREFQAVYARLLFLSLLFRKFEISKTLYEKINQEFEIEKLGNYVKTGNIHVELAMSLIDWYVNSNELDKALELGKILIDTLREVSFSSDFKPLYLLEAYSKIIPVAWYSDNLEYAIDLVEDGEYILDTYGEEELYSKLAFFRLSKDLFIIQSAVSYAAIGNFRFARRLIDSRGFKKETKENLGIRLISLLGSIIVFAESNDPESLQKAVAELYEIGSKILNEDQTKELVNIIEALYVYGEKTYLKDKLNRAFQIATSMLKADPLLHNAFYNSGFLHWLSGQINLVPFKEALSNKKVLFD